MQPKSHYHLIYNTFPSLFNAYHISERININMNYMHQLLFHKSLHATAHMNNTYIYSIVNRVQVYLKIWN